jgi:FtsP/CotA-like multicopper oxidase with cupredoxin domain
VVKRMPGSWLARAVRSWTGLGLLTLFSATLAAQSSPAIPPPPRIQANSNRVPAGTLENGVLSLHLELRPADWYPEADAGPCMKVYAFGEEGTAPQVPGPLIRVPQGSQIRVTLRNFLPAAAVVHGLHQHPGEAGDVVQVAAGEVREWRFVAGAVGTYLYWATAGGELLRGRPFKEDSQLAGAFIVDPPGSVVADRVFVIGLWRSQSSVILSQDIPVINGKSWPYTERLTYAAGEPVRWRWINATDSVHPMHLHGSYYRVDSAGDGERDQIFDEAHQQMVVTHVLTQGTTMSTFWIPLAGRWLFHCHLVAHFLPEMTVANALVAQPARIHEHGADHMAGLAMGITVTGQRRAVVSHGSRRKLRLLVRERAAGNGVAAGYSYQIEEGRNVTPETLSSPGPPLILERGRPVEITVVNQLREPTAVHWHGMELESYYDGVAGWGASGKKITPAVEPGKSFRVRFTPPRAGTFIYHTHINDEVQLLGGLSGPLIVLDQGQRFDPATDHVFILSRGGGDEFTAARLLNGSAEPSRLVMRKGHRQRLRFIGITPNNPGVVSLLGPAGLVKWRAVAKDGADLPSAQSAMQEARQVVWTGETYDFEYEAGEVGSLQLEVENTPTANARWKILQPIEVQ